MKEGEDLMEMQKKHGEVGGGRVMHRAIADAIAGTLAGGVSRTIVSPLDVIKIRFQFVGVLQGRCSWSQQVHATISSVQMQRQFLSTLE